MTSEKLVNNIKDNWYMLIIGFVIILLILHWIFYVEPAGLALQEERTRLDNIAKIECLNYTFYSSNFERCEELGVRP